MARINPAFFRLLLIALGGPLLCCIYSIMPAPTVAAASCYEDHPEIATYSGQANAENDTYDVFVKLPKRGQRATVTTYREQLSEDGTEQCTPSHPVKASGDSWTKVGRWQITDRLVSAYLSSGDLPEEYNANRPTLLLVSAAHPICKPSDACAVTIGGQRGIIMPATKATDENGLVITIPHAIENDSLKEVRYYVDNMPVYTTTTLEDFDMRFVSFPRQHLVRLLKYESGQQVILESTSPDNFTDNFGAFLFRFAYLNSSTNKLVAIIAAVVLFLSVGLFMARLIIARRNWRIHHGFVQLREAQKMPTAKELEQNYQRSRYISYGKKGLATLGVIAAICLVLVGGTRYILTFNQVNGVSMEETIPDKKWLAVNRLPITWGNIIHKQYIPHRGDIVTINEVYGHQSSEDATNDHRQLVKRVIGLPGEHLTIQSGKITIYNTQHPNGFNPDAKAPWGDTMIGDLSSDTLDVQLLSNEVFVMGDNRLVSVDSRMNGPIAVSNIQGVLISPLPF